VNYSRRSRQGNRHMRRILNQAANAAVKYKGSIFEILYRRYVPRMRHNQTIGIIAHKLCRLIWKILHRGIHYEERGPEVRKASKHKRTRKMIRELRSLVPESNRALLNQPSQHERDLRLARFSTLRRLIVM